MFVPYRVFVHRSVSRSVENREAAVSKPRFGLDRSLIVTEHLPRHSPPGNIREHFQIPTEVYDASGPILTVVCGVLLMGGLNAAPVPKTKEKTTEEKLAGKWKLVKTDATLPNYEFVIEYKPKGELAFIRTPKEGKASVSEGKYKVDGEKIEWTVKEGGEDRGETSKIKKLTDDRLILEDPDGLKEEFERVVEKKEKEKENPKKDDK